MAEFEQMSIEDPQIYIRPIPGLVGPEITAWRLWEERRRAQRSPSGMTVIRMHGSEQVLLSGMMPTTEGSYSDAESSNTAEIAEPHPEPDPLTL